jgi:hypothetical protein
MRLRVITATFAIGGSMLLGQTSPPQPNPPKQVPRQNKHPRQRKK